MRHRSFVVAGLILLVTATAAQGQATLRIGYVNSAIILDEAPGAREASDEFNRYLQGSYAEIERMAEELQTMMERFERQQITLSPTARTAQESEIRQRQQAYNVRIEQLEEQAAERQQQLVQPVMDRVTSVIEQLRAEEGYSLILDVAAGSVISADPTLDLTDEVLRRLRAATSGGR